MTGGSVAGQIAIRVDESVLDLAGVSIEHHGVALRAEGGSKIVFSVCTSMHDGEVEYLHGLRSMQSGEEITVGSSNE